MFGKVKIVVILLSALFVAYGLVGGMLEKVSARDDAYRDLSIFTSVLNKVKEEYVEEPNMRKAMQGALQGMMEALDPYSSFVAAPTYQELKAGESQQQASTGIVLSKRYGYAYVVSVMAGSPAEEEGFRNGDILESIDGRVSTEMSLWEAEKRLAGTEGSVVKLGVIRARRTGPSNLELVRKKIAPPEVSARILENGMGLLWIPHFNEGVTKAVSSKLKMLQSSNVRGLVIDVRGAAQGSLKEAVQASDLFLSKGKKILTAKDRNQKQTEFFSLSEPLVSNVPVVLLIDGGTSGAAEVFAAALVDHGIAKTVGERTDGRGSEQEFLRLEDGSVLHISTKLFYRPSGQVIQGQSLKDSGISPDVRCPSQDFMTSFYFDHASEDPEGTPGEEFYRGLNDAIREEQLKEGLKQLQMELSKEAAA